MKVLPPGNGADSARLRHASELFTDRQIESTAFKAALARFRRRIDSDDESGVARHNLLTFYGLGGIGKTALSRRLEDWVKHALPLDNGWGPPPATKVDATARIDLHGSVGQMDILAALLGLRDGVAKLRPRWPVFDLAFAAYWSAVRPGEPLPKHRDKSEIADSVVGTLSNILGDLGSVADLTGVGTGSGLAVLGVRKLIGELRRRHDLRLGIDAFDGFESFLMRCADEPSPTDPQTDLALEIAGALSWELARSTQVPLVAVFVDTIERLTLDPRRISEGYLNTLIYRMPNVLFVLTGRDLLDWSFETRVNLPHRGVLNWPDLGSNAQEPRQHLVGNLSRQDSKTLILRGRRQLDLPMSDDLVDELVRASAGLPEYLELARQVAISIKDAGDGRQVEVSDVTGSIGSLVMRVLDDVPADEQRAIRAACLFRTFDTDLMAAAANVDHGCAERAVRRPMIDHYDGERFPYRMHDAVREAIRRSDHQVAGGWSERDWELAADRAAASAHRLHDDAKAQEVRRDILDAIGIAIQLVCDQKTILEPLAATSAYADWLTRAIVFSPSIQGLRSRMPATSSTEYGQHVINFISAKSIETPIADRLRSLRVIFDSSHPLHLAAGRHLGYTLNTLHRWEDASAVFDEVVKLAPTPLNIGQKPRVLSLARRFDDARAMADGTSAAQFISRVSDYAHGLPEPYFAEIDNKLTKLRAQGRQREYLEELGDYIVRREFFKHDLGTHEITKLLDVAELVGHIVATRSALLAIVLHRGSHRTEVSSALEQLRALDRKAEAENAIGFRYALAEFCDAAIEGSRDRMVRLHATVSNVEFRGRSWIPVEFFLESVGLPLPQMPTQWLEPREVVRDRWITHLDNYLNSNGLAGIRDIAENNTRLSPKETHRPNGQNAAQKYAPRNWLD